MKLTRCDKCGVEGEGRNPSEFHEVPKYEKSDRHADGYYDLCKTCYDEYMTVSMSAMRLAKQSIQLWIDKELCNKCEKPSEDRQDGEENWWKSVDDCLKNDEK